MSLGLQMHVENPEALARFRGVLERATEADLSDRIFWPWVRWVLRVRIPKMYFNKGRVTGSDGQPAWYALSKWTIASKGVGRYASGGSALSPMSTGAMRMAQSYAIAQARTGPQSWRFEMVNVARSTSPWSPGFDYPSALHEGWGPYTVRPKAGKVLSWKMQKGIVIGASMGRSETEGSLIRSGHGRVVVGKGKSAYSWISGKPKKSHKLAIETGDVIAHETHPKGAPPRPHIKFFAIDVAALGKMTLDYVLRGVPPSRSEPAA